MEAEQRDGENPEIIIEAAPIEETEEGNETEDEDSTSYLRLRVSCAELDSGTSNESGSTDSTPPDDRTLLSVPEKVISNLRSA